MQSLNKPNLFVVGFPKCGTTSLHNYLNQHPEICMSSVKEPRFFCEDINEYFRNYLDVEKKKMNYSNYKNIFKTKYEKIVGESSTGYIYSNIAPKQIYEFNKNAKVIIIVREPVDFLLSYHYQLVSGGNEHIKNVLNAHKIRKTKFKNNPTSISPLNYQDKVNFSKHIQKYLDTFPIKNVKIILYEDLKNSPHHTYTNILNFLGVEDKKFIPNFYIYNSSENKQLHLINKIRKKNKLFKKIKNYIPSKLKKIIFNCIKKVNFLEKKNTLSREDKNKLRKKFRDEVVKLQKLLNHNKYNINIISKWKYDK